MAKAKTRTRKTVSKSRATTRKGKKNEKVAATSTAVEAKEGEEKPVVLRVEPIPEEERENPSISRETFYATRTGKPLRGGQEQRRPFYFRQTPYGLIFLFLTAVAALTYFVYQMYLDGRLPYFTPKPSTTKAASGGLFSENGPDAWTYVVIGLVVLLIGATLEVTGMGRTIANSLLGLFSRRKEEGGDGPEPEGDGPEPGDDDSSKKGKKKEVEFGRPFLAKFTRDGTEKSGLLREIQLGSEKFLVEKENVFATDLEKVYKEYEKLFNKQEKTRADWGRLDQLESKIEGQFNDLQKNKIETYEKI